MSGGRPEYVKAGGVGLTFIVAGWDGSLKFNFRIEKKKKEKWPVLFHRFIVSSRTL